MINFVVVSLTNNLNFKYKFILFHELRKSLKYYLVNVFQELIGIYDYIITN